jgi:ribose transport system substrate-binding protein
MKRLYKYVFIGLVVILLSAVVMSMYYYSRIKIDYNATRNQPGTGNKKYHFSMIINNSESQYWKQFKKGAMEACAQYDAAIEFHGIESAEDIAATKEQMRIAVAARNDGVIINALDETSYTSDIEYLVQNGLLVLTTGVEANSNESYYVGTNTYSYYQEAARLVIQSAGESAKIAIIADNTISEISGFSREIQAHYGAEVVVVKKTSSHLIGAEDVVQSILDEYPQVNAIFCMTPEDTMAAAQAIIDRNRVGEVVVTGTDLTATSSVQKYIERNIIYGYIERNPRDIGYQSVVALCNAASGKFQPEYEDIDLDVVTKYNIDQYDNDEEND